MQNQIFSNQTYKEEILSTLGAYENFEDFFQPTIMPIEPLESSSSLILLGVVVVSSFIVSLLPTFEKKLITKLGNGIA